MGLISRVSSRTYRILIMADYLAKLTEKAHQLEVACNDQDVIASRKAALCEANANLRNQISAALDQLQNLEDVNQVPKIAIPERKRAEVPAPVVIKEEPKPPVEVQPKAEAKKKDKKKEKAANRRKITIIQIQPSP